MALIVKISLLRDCVNIPKYQTPGSSGMDLHARVCTPIVIPPNRGALIPTGISLEIPTGYEGQIRSRSGLANSCSLVVLNSPGTIDSDYRGEIKVLLFNHGFEDYTVTTGSRIAQIVFAPIVKVELELIRSGEETPTIRGEGGFGHTGT